MKKIEFLMEQLRDAKSLSPETDVLFNELLLLNDDIKTMISNIPSAGRITHQITFRFECSEQTIREIAEIGDNHLFEPNNFSPYHWTMFESDHVRMTFATPDVEFYIKDLSGQFHSITKNK